LRSVLCGTAFVAISGIALSNENYDMIVTLLKEKLGNQNLLLRHSMLIFSTCQQFQIDLVMMLKELMKTLK